MEDARWKHHPPKDQNIIDLHQETRERCASMCEFIESLPSSRERSVALTKLEEVMFWTNAAIARNQ